MPVEDTSRIFALVIGINKYADPNVTNLHGAVQDANEVQNFLISELGVLKHRIVNLRDKAATREAIIGAMQRLADDRTINPQDPILIYYAGHGSEALPPPNWPTSSANGMVQMLLPHDFNSKGSKNIRGQGIFDMDISQMLSEIAENKSDNITVIFDCCHSASGTRKGLSDKSLTPRRFKLPGNYTIPADLFTPESHSRSRSRKPGLASHVLLAACEQGLEAFEDQVHGLFTHALLCLLKEEGINELSYKDVITHMRHLPSQTPQCEGLHSDRILFSDQVKPRLILYDIRPTPEASNQFTLEAGKAVGITDGVRLTVYSDKHLKSFIGSVVVEKSADYTSRCSVSGPPFNLSHLAYAVEVSRAENQCLRISIDQKDQSDVQLTQLVRTLQADDRIRSTIRFVNPDAEKPDLGISILDGYVQFEIKDEICCEHGLTRMPFNDIHVSDFEKILSILRCAATFYWRLRHSNKVNSLAGKVDVQCFRLIDEGEVIVPEPGDQNLNIDGKVSIDVGGECARPYGFRITNSLSFSLYVALFYFDMSDLSIVAYYLPVMANKKADVSLPAKRSMTIGFGDGGWPPRQYFHRYNQSIDVGFLKLYVSTRYVDYSGICQLSPFQHGRASAIYESKKEVWSTFTIPIIQRKR